jgi:hypothetical protein
MRLRTLALAATVVAGLLATGSTAVAAANTDAAAKPVSTAAAHGQPSRATAHVTPTARTDGAHPALAGTVSLRFFWGLRTGDCILSLTGLPVTAGQAVMVSATDSDGAGNEQIGPERTTIYNVAVVDGQVVVFLNITSPRPINLWLHYLA